MGFMYHRWLPWARDEEYANAAYNAGRNGLKNPVGQAFQQIYLKGRRESGRWQPDEHSKYSIDKLVSNHNKL